jgi:hypothetical protein
MYVFLISPMRAICPVHIILLDLIAPVISGEVYKLWISSLCSLLRPPTLFLSLSLSLLGQNIVLNYLFSNTLNLCSSLSVSPIKNV